MKTVRARLGADAYDSTLIVAKFGGGILRDQIEFLNGVDTRRVAHLVILVFAIQNAID